MALIHQNLYSEDNLTGINVKSYLEKLIEGLFNSYNINKDKVTLGLYIEDIELDVDLVIPLGLIANELVTNALKHAFTEQDQGKIIVALSTDKDGLKSTVKDNGKGIETTLNIEEMESFGFQMIYAFKEKLQAELLIENKNGTSVNLIIKDFQKNK
ncbi:MAG: two-component sensor histidine kinase [Saprospiraceae bacterium]|jgi:two-component sensor histidine kinase|tara:strand:- start:537 stop:1004 length:468 start_codon:yes stop_codon:yes gene_type:complete